MAAQCVAPCLSASFLQRRQPLRVQASSRITARPCQQRFVKSTVCRRTFTCRASTEDAVAEVAEVEAEEAVEDVEAEAGSEEEEEEEEEEEDNAQSLEEVMAAEKASEDSSVAAPITEFRLSFLWLDKNIGVAVDQVFGKQENRTPVTEYFFWPKKDAWEELKQAIEQKPWVSERDKVVLLNRTTEVINFWQDEVDKHPVKEAQEKFPDCKFMGV